MTQQIHQFAQDDTPSKIQVPEGWAGILMWAVGRFGGGIVIAMVCVYMLDKVYADYQRQNSTVLSALTAQVEVNAKHIVIMEELRKTIQELTTEARAAHRWQTQTPR